MMPTAYRPKDEPWPGGRGVYDWQRGGFVPVLERESAGQYLDRKSHRVIVPRHAPDERCALNGGRQVRAKGTLGN